MPSPEPSDHEHERIEQLRRAMYSRDLSDKLHERPRRQLDEERPLVGEDWRENTEEVSGLTVAPRMIGATRAVLRWVLVIAVVFFVAALSFFAYYFLFGGGSLPANPANIDISVSGPPQIRGGSPAELQIVVTNKNRVALELADLVITYPKGTRKPNDYATDFPSTRISLGTIGPGATKQGTVNAVFSGNEGELADVKVDLEYHIGGSNSIFVASSDYAFSFSSSPLSISVDGNTQTISGQPVLFTINVTSNANAPLRDVLFSADYPFGFKLTSANPAANKDGLWPLGDILPGQKKTIQIQGTLTGEEGDSRVFHFTAGTRASSTATVITTPLADTAYALQVSQPFLGLTVAVNNQGSNSTGTVNTSTASSGAPVIVKPGDTVTVSIGYQNNLPTAITNAVIVARLSGIQIDGSTVRSSDGFYRSTDDTVLWNTSTTNGVLSNLAPGAKGSVSFSFQMPASASLVNVSNPHLTISVNAAGKRVSETGVPQNLQSTTNKEIRLATDLQLVAQGFYYGNPFGSAGPMPPKAGSETNYAIAFTIVNTTNKITKAKLTAKLPAYVRAIHYGPSTENLTFNQTDGTVTWDVGDIAPGVGLNGTSPRQAAIEIAFTPSTSQIGEQPPLIQGVTLTGTDEATGATITRSATPDVTTNLIQIGRSPTATLPGTDPGFTPVNATVVKP